MRVWLRHGNDDRVRADVDQSRTWDLLTVGEQRPHGAVDWVEVDVLDGAELDAGLGQHPLALHSEALIAELFEPSVRDHHGIIRRYGDGVGAAAHEGAAEGALSR